MPRGLCCLPYALCLTHDCVASSCDSLIVKFADDTTIVGFIQLNNEATYRDQVDRLVGWCAENNLELIVNKTKEIIV